jgi:hypothetical protein
MALLDLPLDFSSVFASLFLLGELTLESAAARIPTIFAAYS